MSEQEIFQARSGFPSNQANIVMSTQSPSGYVTHHTVDAVSVTGLYSTTGLYEQYREYDYETHLGTGVYS